MLARSVERPIKEEGQIFGHEAQIVILSAGRSPCEDLQRRGEQPVIGARVDGEARRERVAEIRRHGREDRTLEMTVAVKEGVDLSEPAEGVGKRDKPSEIVCGGVSQEDSGVLQ